MKDKDTFEFEVEKLPGDGVGLELCTRKHLSSKGNDHGLDQCFGSGMFIPDPDFCPSRIPGSKTATKERAEKKIVVLPFL
jgi:hypothetical protein